MRTIVAIKIEAPKRFDSLGGMPDDRDGMYSCDIRMERLTLDGTHVATLEADGWSQISHSGLHQLQQNAYETALDLARAMRKAVLALDVDCYLAVPDKFWQGSDEFLSQYLEARQVESERKARKAEMIAKAKAMLAEANAL